MSNLDLDYDVSPCYDGTDRWYYIIHENNSGISYPSVETFGTEEEAREAALHKIYSSYGQNNWEKVA